MNKKALLAALAAAIAGIVIGAVIGATANSHSGEIGSLNGRIKTLSTNLAVARTIIATQKNEVTQAQAAARNAQAQAKAQYAAKMAQANALLAKLKHEQGVVQASTISADGVYIVGHDIPPGTYHTTGGSQCYYATLGSTDTSNIMDNNNFNGPETVDVSGAYAFQIQGGCTWTKVG